MLVVMKIFEVDHAVPFKVTELILAAIVVTETLPTTTLSPVNVTLPIGALPCCATLMLPVIIGTSVIVTFLMFPFVYPPDK